jgi:hypothetical protein
MNRPAVVAGQFYPGTAAELDHAVDQCLVAESREKRPTVLAMVPHAGYVFSGPVCGRTLAEADLHSTIVLLGPNHTGLGASLSLWPDGAWELPGAEVPVDDGLADILLREIPQLTADRDAHVREHSLEVVLPFLRRLQPKVCVVPIAVAEPDPAVLQSVGTALGRTLADHESPVSMVVSSDMSHYVSHEQARELDAMALEPVLHLDPGGLYSAVREHHISMCGVLPMTLALHAAREMGATKARLAAYATSGEASGDYEQVVGYAGVLVS